MKRISLEEFTCSLSQASLLEDPFLLSNVLASADRLQGVIILVGGLDSPTKDVLTADVSNTVYSFFGPWYLTPCAPNVIQAPGDTIDTLKQYVQCYEHSPCSVLYLDCATSQANKAIRLLLSLYRHGTIVVFENLLDNKATQLELYDALSSSNFDVHWLGKSYTNVVGRVVESRKRVLDQ
jgi:hypothetical protein